MINRRTRISGALLLVLISLLLASLACYSGQIPGVFELTPYATETPIPIPEEARFKLLETVLAPHEADFTFFNLTLFPEPLLANLLNSKTLCQPNSPAQVLYIGQADDGETYYLINCTGSIGWAKESRLAGPLKFEREDLALSVSQTGQPLELLDEKTFQPVISFMMCQPETVVLVLNIQAADVEGDGNKEVYYLIECPVGNRGWVSNDDLFGPLKVNVKDYALAINASGVASGDPYPLASEAAPITEDNMVEGECIEGAKLEIKAAERVEDTAYYQVVCGDIEGWVAQDDLIGPLEFDPGMNAIIYIPPVLLFEDELPADAGGIVASLDEETEPGEATAEAETEVEPVGTAAADADGESEEEQRRVVEYISPAYLTSSPGVVVSEGEDSNVVGRCVSGTSAHLLEYAGINDKLYHRISCDECVEFETTDSGETLCVASEPVEGWIDQDYLHGPIDFVPGDRAVFKSSSAAVTTDELDGKQYAQIPATTTGASALGRFTEFSGRCPYENGVEVTRVLLEQARTSNKFNFYYEIQCEGQVANVRYETDHAGKTRPIVEYDAEAAFTTVSGYALARDLEALED